MALRVWLPLNGNLNNNGLSDLGSTSFSNVTWKTDGKIGKCANGCGIYHLNQDIIPGNIWTVSAWVRCPSTWGQYNNIVICINDADMNTCHIYLSIINGTQLNIGFNNTAQRYTVNYTFESNKWYHIAASYDGTTATLYANGVLLGTSNITSTVTNCLNLAFGGRANNAAGTSYTQSGVNLDTNDVRIYDECLSQKQIKEISKGLVAHYKLDNPYIENTTNLVTGIDNKTIISVNNSPAWDTTYNGTPMYTPTGWSSGYNSGVTDATHGYHARWIQENGKWVMMFPNLNSVINQKGRWLGISGNADTANILAGEKYTISWWQKTDNLSLAAYGGIYYKKTSDGTQNFWDGNNTLGYNTKLNTWERMTRVFTRNSEYVQHSTAQYIYVYGYNSTYEGTVYVKDVQVERGDHATPFSIGTRNLTYETDDSGNGFNAPKYGTLISNINTPKYDICTNFSSGYLHKIPSPLNSGSDAFTISCWFYPTQNATMCLINDRTAVGDGLALFYYGGGIRFDTGSSYQWQVGSITLNAWNHVVVTWDKNAGNKKLYLNGTLINTTTSYGTLTNIGSVFSIGNSSTNGAAGAGNQIYGSLSDFRIYATALTADDILTLYKTSGIIDNKGNVYAYEFKEE